MKIEQVTIENYRSIKELEITPNKGLNVFVGENSVGKSNIFNAINSLLGPTFPSFNSVTELDHWEGNLDNKIRIKLEYDNNSYLELAEEWQDSRGNVKSGLNLSGNYVKSDQREAYCSAYLGIDREILDYLPSNKWSLLGRILQQMHAAFLVEEMDVGNGEMKLKKDVLKERLETIRDEVLFSVGRSSPASDDGHMDQFLKVLQTESARQLNRDPDEFFIDLSIYDPWNFYRTLQLLVKEAEMDMQFQASTLGMGVQASITIAILKAYASLHLPNKTPIFLDEPELFLHPQAQRNFYNLLREMTQDEVDPETGAVINEGLQIFYTTHSPNFLQADHFDEIFLVRKNKEIGTHCHTATIDTFIDDLQERRDIVSSKEYMFLQFKNAYENTGDSQRANEAFFARKIILVEGPSESLALPYLFGLYSFDDVREGISIVCCGSKGEIDRFFRLYNEFGIPCYVIFDGDRQHEDTQAEDETRLKNRAILGLFSATSDWPDGNVHDRYFGFENEFEKHLGFETSKKGLNLYKEIKAQITGKEHLPDWMESLVGKIIALDSPLPSVLKTQSKPDEAGGGSDEIRLDDIPF